MANVIYPLRPISEIPGDSEYAAIPGWPGYAAGKDGSIWSTRNSGKWRQSKAKPTPASSNYILISLQRTGRKETIFAHRLVLLAFVGPGNKGDHTRHLNGIRHDNRLENLAWGTPKENAEDRYAHGTHGIGSNHNQAKYTEEQVCEIRRLRAEGVPPKEIAAMYGATRENICEVSRGASWSHLPGAFQSGHNNKLTEDMVREIRNLAKSGLAHRKIAERFRVGNTCIYKVLARKTYKNVV